MAPFLLFLAVFSPLTAESAMSQLSSELLSEGLMWMNGEGVPTTMCIVLLSNGSSVAQTCTMTDGFGPRSIGCFVVWNGVRLLQQGCYSNQEISLRDQCQRRKCVADEKKKAVSFCCCHGALCNAEYA